jgi:prephenate dehydrogenase
MADDIRSLADEVLEDAAAPVHPMAGPHDREIELARFALAVLDALDEAAGRANVAIDRGDYHYFGAVEAIRRAIAEKYEEARRGR